MIHALMNDACQGLDKPVASMLRWTLARWAACGDFTDPLDAEESAALLRVIEPYGRNSVEWNNCLDKLRVAAEGGHARLHPEQCDLLLHLFLPEDE